MSLIGKRFGSYQILALLGEGGMATVYRAQHSTMQREVAIKVIRPELAGDEEFVKRFEREAQMVASLSHPHILKIFEYGQQKKNLFLVMELLSGGNLSAQLTGSPLPIATITRVLNQICQALDYAHNLSIIHRDLKPHNILLDGNGNAILTDFGLAKLMADTDKTALTQSGSQMGTPMYMAPEQWRADTLDHRADLYALGLMLFEMLTGVHPFKSETTYELMHKHVFGAPPLLSTLRNDLPAALEQMVKRALAKDREERYPSAGAFYEAFQAALQNGQAVTIPSFTIDMKPEASGISTSRKVAQAQEAIEQLEAERMDTIRTPRSITERLIGTLPQDVSERYVGRAKQVTDVMNLLTDKTRLVSIYGRVGVGKTALACKVLSDLQAEQALDGIVSLSAANGNARLDRILADFGRLLGGDDRIMLEGVMRDGGLPAVQKTAVLLEKLRDGHFALYLDNLETLQDSTTGTLNDADLQTFIETVLEQGGGLRILITSREPLTVPRGLKTWERIVPLDEGLPTTEAIMMLRAIDPDGAAGLRDADESQLEAIVYHTGGYPRALEAIAGLLLDDPLVALDDLIHDISLLTGEITPIIVQQAIARLSHDALRVLQSLALIGRPVKQTALEFLLAPFMDTAKLRELLGHLVRTYFVTFNKASQQFSLHPMDKAYCYGLIPTSNDTAFNRAALHQRAAEYYRLQRKPQPEWRSVEDVQPQLAEFDHLVAIGSYDDAARLLLSIDRDYLWDWGQGPLLAELHGRLRGSIQDTRLAHQNLRRIAGTGFFTNLEETAAMYESLLEETRRTGDVQAEADALDDLAQTWRGRGNFQQGFQFHQQALEIYRQIGNKRGQAEALGGMGASIAFVRPENAVGYLEEAVVIQRELNNLQSVVFLLWTMGNAYTALGQFETAMNYSQQAIALAGETKNSRILTRALHQLGQVYSYIGEHDKALDYCRQAAEAAQNFSGGQLTNEVVYARIFWSYAQAFIGDIEGALLTLPPINRTISTPLFFGGGAWLLSLLLLLKGDVSQAREVVTPILTQTLTPAIKVYQGMILIYTGETQAAIEIFETSLNWLEKVTLNFMNLHAKALSLAALVLLKADSSQLGAVVDTYRQACATAKAPGYEQFQLRLYETLMQAPGGEILTELRTMLVR